MNTAIDYDSFIASKVPSAKHDRGADRSIRDVGMNPLSIGFGLTHRPRKMTPKEYAARRDPAATRGVRNPHAILQEADIRAIRASTETQRAIAKRFGTTQANISKIKLRQSWSHVSDQPSGDES